MLEIAKTYANECMISNGKVPKEEFKRVVKFQREKFCLALSRTFLDTNIELEYAINLVVYRLERS